MEVQHTHATVPLQSHSKSIIVACDGLHSPANIGALFRLCDAFGVEKIMFSIAINLQSSRLKRTARSTEKKIAFQTEVALTTEIIILKNKGYSVIGLEITSNSIPIENLALDTSNKIVLIIGNERHGISSEIIKLTDYCTHINMFGTNSSINVIQATAIALHQMTKS